MPAQLPGLCFLLEAVLPALATECVSEKGSARLARSAACCVCSASSGSGSGPCAHIAAAYCIQQRLQIAMSEYQAQRLGSARLPRSGACYICSASSGSGSGPCAHNSSITTCQFCYELERQAHLRQCEDRASHHKAVNK